jgi:hypothetical protein
MWVNYEIEERKDIKDDKVDKEQEDIMLDKD